MKQIKPPNETNQRPELRFSLIGPLRSGSSLLARCIDDHPQAICLCESEINRTLFPHHAYSLHALRMKNHGLAMQETLKLLDGKWPYQLDGFERWHQEVFSLLRARHEKPDARIIGDKSPDFYRSPKLVEHLVAKHRLIYTVRDPRAIYRSIHADIGESEQAKRRRWAEFCTNYQVWKPHLDRSNLLVVKYEQLITEPQRVMAEVHRHLRLGDSTAFLEAGPRKYPQRFLWSTNVNMDSGEVRCLDPTVVDRWRDELLPADIARIESDPIAADFSARFGYGKTASLRSVSRAEIVPPLPRRRNPQGEASAGDKKTALILHWAKGPILTHIESSLAELGFQTLGLARTVANIAEIVRTIETRRPTVCVTRQRLYPDMAAISRSLAANRCRTVFADLGVWPHYGTYLLDHRGENASSSLVGRLADLDKNDDIRQAVNAWAGAVKTMRDTLRKRAELAHARTVDYGLDVPNGYTLLVLQREGDQVLIHDADERWRDPADVARMATLEAERQERFVVIKTHPQSKVRAKLDLPLAGAHHRIVPDLKFGGGNDEQLAWLIANAGNVIAVNSTCHFQSLALGIPTACLGRGWFTGNDVVLEAQTMAEAFSNSEVKNGDRYLLHLISRQMPVADFAEPEKLERLLAWLERCEVAEGDGGRRLTNSVV